MTRRNREFLRREIRDAFEHLNDLKERGIWFGEKDNSEYIEWYPDGRIMAHYTKNKYWPEPSYEGEIIEFYGDVKIMDWGFWYAPGSKIINLEKKENYKFAKEKYPNGKWFKINL